MGEYESMVEAIELCRGMPDFREDLLRSREQLLTWIPVWAKFTSEDGKAKYQDKVKLVAHINNVLNEAF